MLNWQAEMTFLFFGLLCVLLCNYTKQEEKALDPAVESRQFVPHNFHWIFINVIEAIKPYPTTQCKLIFPQF